ncbi:hypothetical protein [Anaerorhabdus furcosa]|uniref:Uncharacterized protein n=1 Tax=Anaerorhabdus furcosa TaxID=118967 RepID=A0A1T4JUG2_9FIRM|nr:hypothetical protein [Anaerorhabdus furcosa]SJZ33806.1 hypothetical protein SAMN02745191_0085 [Anaerorhabdus furcosa]
MSQNRKKVKNQSKRKLDRTSKIILIGGALIVVPFIIFGFILLSASFNTGKPIFGDRFKGDLDPAITSSNISEIESKVKSQSGVEKVSVELSSATLRVYVDITDSASSAEATSIADAVYNDVVSVLPEGTYFKLQDGKKMYDIEVHVYNLAKDRDSENFVYVIKNKSSNMETARSQVVSDPLDAELAQQLRDDVENRNNPTPTPNDDEMTVGGADDGTEAQPDEGKTE